jgi:tripartite-type tricarboxylate transporter receptor subunit TctC
MGQTVLVENKGGGGGNIATEFVARSAPDGYTILLTGNNHTLNVSLYPKSPYKLEDFRPVIELTRGPSVFVAAENAPFKTLKELVTYASAPSAQVAFGSPGVGLPSHIAMELFERAAKIDLVHAPYKGSGPSLTDLMGGQIPVVTATLAAAMPHIKGGKIRALAVTSAERWPSLPNVPTVAESGYPNYRAPRKTAPSLA